MSVVLNQKELKPEADPRTVVRVVLPGTAFPMVKPGAVDRARAEGRTLHQSEIEVVEAGGIARFTPTEWNALPETTKTRFGYISQTEVHAAAVQRFDAAVAEWQARVDGKRGQVKAFDHEAEATIVRLYQQGQQMRNDLGYLEAELARAKQNRMAFESQAQAEAASFRAAAAAISS